MRLRKFALHILAQLKQKFAMLTSFNPLIYGNYL